MARHRFLLLVVAFACAPDVCAQSRAGSVEAHYLALDDARFGPARMDGFETGLRAWTPTFGAGFAVGADYTYTHYSYEGLATRDRDLHRLAIPVEWSSSGTTFVTLSAIPTVATSSNVFQDLFSRGTGDDVELYARATVRRGEGEGWGWSLGVAYDDSFGDPEVYPVAAMTFASTNIALELGWPRTRAHWRANGAFGLGIEIEPAGARWHVVSDERDGAEFNYIVEAWRAALIAECNFASRWKLAARIGSEFDRHHDFEDDTGARVDVDAQSAAFAAFVLGFEF